MEREQMQAMIDCQRAPDAAHEGEGAPVNLPPEEADAVLDELVATASRMAVERAAEWSRSDARQSEDRQMAFAQSLLSQEDALRQEQPDFDLEQLLRTSTAFRALVMAGEPVARAFEYVRPAQDVEDAGDVQGAYAAPEEEQALQAMPRRGTRPQSMGLTGRPAPKAAEERLDEEEIGRIDAQLKRGRKVYLNY